MLQTIIPAKKLEIGLIKSKKNRTIIKQIVQANLEDSYCSKLRNALKTSYEIEKIDFCHFSNLSIKSENCICWFGQLWISEGLN